MASIRKSLINSKSIASSIRKSLKELMDDLCPLPSNAIVLGMASDGLPVLMDVSSPITPNIVVWNALAHQGLRILKVIAEYVFRYRKSCGYKSKTKVFVEFLVLTRTAEDWGDLNQYGMGMTGNTSCIGIIPFYSELADKVVGGLARWINEQHSSSKQPVIILIDGMENLNRMNKDFQFNLRYILLHGRTKNVYVIGTAEHKNFAQVQEWLEGFQAEIYGNNVNDLFQMHSGQDTVIFYTPQTEMI